MSYISPNPELESRLIEKATLLIEQLIAQCDYTYNCSHLSFYRFYLIEGYPGRTAPDTTWCVDLGLSFIRRKLFLSMVEMPQLGTLDSTHGIFRPDLDISYTATRIVRRILRTPKFKEYV